MSRFIKFLILFIFISTSSLIANQDIYMDNDFKHTTKQKARYLGKISNEIDGLWYIEIFDIKKDNHKIISGNLTKPEFKYENFKDQEFMVYFYDGSWQKRKMVAEDRFQTWQYHSSHPEYFCSTFYISNNAINSDVVYYNSLGEVTQIQTYKDGMLQGLDTTYNPKTKEVIKIVNYNNGKLDGEYIEYSRDGKNIRKKANYKDGKLDGEYIEYTYDGKNIFIKTTYKDGKIDGLYELYSYDGILEHNGTYKNDNKIGKHEYFYNLKHTKIEEYSPDGVIFKTTSFFIDDNNVSEEIIYDELGREIDKKEYLRDLYGDEIFLSSKTDTKYDNSSKMIMKKNYRYIDNNVSNLYLYSVKYTNSTLDDKNRVSVETSYHQNGTILNRSSFKNYHLDGEQIYTDYYQTTVSNYKDNILDGLYTTYNTTSKDIITQGLYKNGTKNGLWVESRIYDNFTEFKTYKDGVLDGNYTAVYKNGDKLVTTYKNDMLNGKYTIFDKDNNTIESKNYISGELNGDTFKQINKTVVERGKYINFKKEGHWLYEDNTNYYEKYYCEGKFKNDIKTGKHKCKFINGQIANVAMYNKYGNLDGSFYIFLGDGFLSQIDRYKNGELTQRTNFNKYDSEYAENIYFKDNRIVQKANIKFWDTKE